MQSETKEGMKGHRSRLRERIFDGDEKAVLDYELIEYLLGLRIWRGDTKKIAKRLLRQFGGFARLLDTHPKTLQAEGLSEAQIGALKIASLTARRLLEARIEEMDLINSFDALKDYLHVAMAHRNTEQVRVLYLDSKNRLIANEPMSDGTVDESALYIREVMSRAITHGAAAIILVHNHPSGDATPSPADIRITRELVEAARHMKVTVHDHIIVGAKGQTSLRAEGLL